LAPAPGSGCFCRGSRLEAAHYADDAYAVRVGRSHPAADGTPHSRRRAATFFFYGEAYGGSTDSYLVAIFFRLFGDTVAVGRMVQSLECLVGMAFTYLLARRLMPDARLGPLAALWLMAIPPLLMSTWATPAVLYSIVC